MARSPRSLVPGAGGVLRTIERVGVTRGVFGSSRGWFYVGTSLWVLRKVRALGEGRSELLVSEPLRPGERMVIANGVATIEAIGHQPSAGASHRTSRRERRKQRRTARKDVTTLADLSRRERRRLDRGR